MRIVAILGAIAVPLMVTFPVGAVSTWYSSDPMTPPRSRSPCDLLSGWPACSRRQLRVCWGRDIEKLPGFRGSRAGVALFLRKGFGPDSDTPPLRPGVKNMSSGGPTLRSI